MKKLRSCLVAMVLFAVTASALLFWVSKSTEDTLQNKSMALTYHNTDARNQSKEIMGQLLSADSIPVFGSSELSAADKIAYPPELFQQGNSDFNMVLIGRGSMQSLHQAITVGALSDEIASRKAVLIVSPQWFTEEHLSSTAYASRFSEQLYVEMLKNSDISEQTKRAIAHRVEEMLQDSPAQLAGAKDALSVYLSGQASGALRLERAVTDRFSAWKQKTILAREIKNLKDQTDYTGQKKVQVEEIDFSALMRAAQREGELACTNNDMYIYDEYYDLYVRDSMEEKHNSQTEESYGISPEYGDLRLFLDVCRETGIEPLIVNIPVSGIWYDWTGFPKDDREMYYQNIRDICKEYDVEVADFSDKEYEPYFLKDIMHLGWKGWVYLDQAVYQFYQSK